LLKANSIPTLKGPKQNKTTTERQTRIAKRAREEDAMTENQSQEETVDVENTVHTGNFIL
jgi:hypothetical protein